MEIGSTVTKQDPSRRCILPTSGSTSLVEAVVDCLLFKEGSVKIHQERPYELAAGHLTPPGGNAFLASAYAANARAD